MHTPETSRRRSSPRTLVSVAMVAALALCAAACTDDPPTRHQGSAGYGCYFDADCLGALVCAQTTAAEFPVCTGHALEGDSCSEAAPCAWIRDSRGLPLSCEVGMCAFPPDDLDA